MADTDRANDNEKNTLPPPEKKPLPPPHLMDEANKELKKNLDTLIKNEEFKSDILNERELIINNLDLSDEKSKRLANEIYSSDSGKNGYFDDVRNEIIESENWIKGTRKKSISDLSSEDIVSRLMLKDEKLSTNTILKVKTCYLDGEIMGFNMDFLLTDKRLIIVDNDEDVINTISGNYNGNFPKSAKLSIESRNYLNILFQPFRLGDITDINFNFKHGSETRKTMSRGWPNIAIIGTWFLFFLVAYPSLGIIFNDFLIGFMIGFICSLFIPIIMLLFPIKWATKKNPVYLTHIRNIKIRIVNKYTKNTNLLNVEVDEKQSIDSILNWVEKLQSTSSVSE